MRRPDLPRSVQPLLSRVSLDFLALRACRRTGVASACSPAGLQVALPAGQVENVALRQPVVQVDQPDGSI